MATETSNISAVAGMVANASAKGRTPENVEAEVVSSKQKAEPVNKLDMPELDLNEQLERMRDIVERLNESLQSLGRSLDFSVDHRLNRYVVTVQDKDSGEVIRVIPGEEMLRMAHRIEDLKGIIFNEDI